MRTIKIVGLTFVLACITTIVHAQCYGCCYAGFNLSYDSISDICQCAVRPSVPRGQAWPIYGNIEETIVTYDSVIIRNADTYCDVDTLYSVGTFDQANEMLKIDCSQLSNGSYFILATVHIENRTDTLATWGCNSFDQKMAGVFSIQRQKSTKLDEIQVQEPNNPLLNIYARDGQIFCSGDFRIYDILGRDVTHLNGNLNGCYIVTNETNVRKIIVH